MEKELKELNETLKKINMSMKALVCILNDAFDLDYVKHKDSKEAPKELKELVNMLNKIPGVEASVEFND